MKLGFGWGLVLILGAAALPAVGCHGESLNTQNGRCGPIPQLLLGAAAFPAPDAAGERAVLAGMALDGSDLYLALGVGWSDAVNPPAQPSGPGELLHISTFGGSATELAGGYDFFQTPVVAQSSVIVGAASISSSTDVSILSVPRSGGAATPLVALAGDLLFTLPVTDGTSVYFAHSAGVAAVPLAPAASPAVPMPLSSESAVSLGVFGQRLLLLLSTGEVKAIPIGSSDAGSEVSLGTGFPHPLPQSLIPCGANACWVADAIVEQMDPAGGLVTALTALSSGPVADPSTLLFDGTSFFVLGTSGPYTNANATIVRIPQGGPAVIVATLPPSSSGLAVDDACVYFGTSTGIFTLLKDSEGVVVP